MKELTIEEKAAHYDEASKWMENVYPTLSHEQQMEAEEFFPMFKESEDERIRKYLLKLADRCPEDSIDFMGEVKKEDIISWLEKQGEQKSIDEIAKEVGKDKASAVAFLKKACIMNENGELAEQYRQGEQKPAWSEEDEQYIIDTLNLLSFGCSVHTVGEVQDFIKSLKYRYTWKPSEEQMDALLYIFRHYRPNATDKLAWESLQTLNLMLAQLKKLREE